MDVEQRVAVAGQAEITIEVVRDQISIRQDEDLILLNRAHLAEFIDSLRTLDE